ncbi:MAG: hypothetical protein R6W73_04105 [Candidatus Saliniplasma sp.]
MEGPDQKSLWEESEQYGGWKRSYKKLGIIGLIMTIVGIITYFAASSMNLGGENLSVMSALLAALGLLIGVAGGIGYLDEKQKEGKERIRTIEGFASVILLIVGMLVFSSMFYLFLALNTLAIILGVVGMKKGDNTIAIGGVIGGIIMFVFAAILIYLVSFPIG